LDLVYYTSGYIISRIVRDLSVINSLTSVGVGFPTESFKAVY